MLRNRLMRGGALLAAVLISLVVAPAAFAATISLNQPCYIVTDLSGGANITVSGSGFNPGEVVFPLIPAPGGLLGYTEAKVAPDGSLTATVEDIEPGTVAPVVETQTMQITSATGAVLAEAPFKLSVLSVRTKPGTAPSDKKVTYHFSGFGQSKPIFGHYLQHGHVALTHKFGTASGPCGVLKAKARIYPGRGKGKYEVQFDDRRKYSPKTVRKFVTFVSTF